MTTPLYNREERHRALGRDATLSWSRALTHPPRCNRTCHRVIRGLRGRTLCLWQSSWIRCRFSDVIGAKETPILLLVQTVCNGSQQTTARKVIFSCDLFCSHTRVGPDLGPNCLQWLSPDDKRRR